MDLQRQEYPSMLKSLQPSQAIKLLNTRLHHVRTLNSDVAEWLQERRRIEEQYAISLRRLAAKQLGQENLDMGVFTTPWQKITEATDSIAGSHHAFAKSIETEVEKPLRTYATSSRELANMDNIVGNIQAIAKELDNAEKAAEKLKAKGGKASADKVAAAASSIEEYQGQWDSQAPYVFERLQEIDEQRLELIQKCLTQFQTSLDEVKNASSASVELCLNSLLNVQIVDEIQHFSMKAPGSIPATTTRERRMSRPQAPPPVQETSSMAPPAIPTLNVPEDRHSERSNSIQETPIAEKRSSKFGLKRLGTVMKGRRHSTHPYSQSLQSPEKKRSSTNLASKFPSFSRKTKEHPEALTPQVTGSKPPTERQPSENPRPSDSGTAPSLERITSTQSKAVPSEHSTDAGPSMVNGNHQAVESAKEAEEPQPGSSPNLAPPVVEEPAPSTPPLQGSDAITQAMNEAAAVSGDGQQQFKVDIRNAPIAEEDGDATAALASVTTALRAQATPRRSGTNRGRRDRNTMILPSTSVPELPTLPGLSASTSSLPTTPVPGASPSSPPMNAAPFKIAHRSALETNDSAASDTHSIRSGRSLSSTVSNTIRHPEMHDEGLNASMVETISAWFEGGECTRAMQIGEVALVYNSPDSSQPSGTETIRFNGFEKLEKVAPNPQFIDAVASKEGTYSVNLAHIARTSVAFKYQVHLDSSTIASYAPLRVVPAFKVEASQTLVMLSYSFNPAFSCNLSEGVSSISLNNVILILHVEPGSGRVSRCQAQGGGVYARERNLIYWRLNELKLQVDGTPLVQRAKFITEGEIKPGKAEARWELGGEQMSQLGSGIGLSRQEVAADSDPFADDDSAAPTPTMDWKEVSVVRRLRSGTYVAAAAA